MEIKVGQVNQWD